MPFDIEVSRDHLTATIRLREDADASAATAGEAVIACQAAKVDVNADVTKRIDEYIKKIQNGEDEFEPSVIAEGRAVYEGKDGYFEWYESIKPSDEAINEDEDATKLSHYDVTRFVVVDAGDVIGHVTPPEPAATGVDVHGHELPVRNQPREFRLGENVALADDGMTVVALEPGRVQHSPWEIAVLCVLDIADNVDFSVGHIDSPTPVCVRGNIQDLFRVRTAKWLSVGGAIEAAEVEAADFIEVRGGILNRDKGYVKAGGKLNAKFCAEATVDAEGDITIGKEVLNSKLRTQSRVIIPNGAVIGGKVYARIGVEARTLGSDAGVPTSISVGIPEELLRDAKTVEVDNVRRRRSVKKIRDIITPVMDHGDMLAEHQRVRATELLARTDDIESRIEQTEEALKNGLAAIFVPSATNTGDTDGESGPHEIGPYVLFQSKVCQGVTVRIDDKVTSFVKEMKGPIRICKRRVKNHTILAAINQLTGSVIELNSRKFEFEDEEEPAEQEARKSTGSRKQPSKRKRR
jgi:uncharacterized protein (DUF342 family)